ncbi:MAG: Hsp20/alpha crystallin family protein [Maribacter sp.]|uniref:Hsp20/alpha crystallin family protein n=1 Tax=Maribacter sp. TaxID=1897614 RepID=UPI0032998CF2
MSIVKRNNLVFPALINEIFKPDWFGGLETVGHNLPPVNIKENEGDWQLQLLVPGRVKEDFHIEIDKDVLTVSTEVKTEEVKKEGRYSRREFSFQSFKRSFTLPNTIDAENIKGDYENGILSFVLPKKEEAMPKPKRQIELS